MTEGISGPGLSFLLRLLPPPLLHLYSMRYTQALLCLASVASLTTAATVCNGYSQYCSQIYSNVTVVGAHNSYTDSNTNLAANQDYGVTQQLTDGIRLLQNQVHLNNGALTLCHTSCLLYNGGLLTDYLTKVQTWMAANPNEVVTLLLVNIDDQPVASFQTAFVTAGLDTISYSPAAAVTETSAWPTLGSMIDSGKRLVTFMDNGANFATVPWLIDEFTNMWEDYFDVESAAGFNCSIQRFKGDTTNQMYLINHYMLTETSILGVETPVPNKAALPVTNAVSGAGSLGEEALITCPPLHARPPTFLLVDFYDWGNGSVFQVAAQVNGVPYVAKSIAPQNGTDSTSSSGSGSTTTTSSLNAATHTSASTFLTGMTLMLCVLFGSFAAI